MSDPAKKERPKTTPRTEPFREPGTEVVQPLRERAVGKKKAPGLVVNKAAEIRRVANVLVAEGEIPRPKTIRERLRRDGLTVTSQQVSMALANTEFAYRRIQVDQRQPPVVFPEPTLALSQVSIDDVLEARKFVERLGSLEKAMAALVALGQFGGGASKPSELVHQDSLAEKRETEKASDESE
jgi:hypothetical protein